MSLAATLDATDEKKGQYVMYCPFFYVMCSRKLEREKRLELSTSTLARLRSTN